MAFNITTNYAVNTPPLTPDKIQGMRISLARAQYRFCAFEAEANGDLECGVFVTLGTDAMGDNTLAKPTSASAKIAGVTYYNKQRPLIYDATLDVYKYPDGEIVTLMEEGDIVMYAEKAVGYLDPVYVRHTVDTGLTRIGALSNAAGTGLVLVPGAKFIQKTSAAGKVDVSLQDIV